MKRWGMTPITVRFVPVEPKLSADDGRLAAKLPLPEIIAENGDRQGPRPGIGGVGVRPRSGGTPITSNVLKLP